MTRHRQECCLGILFVHRLSKIWVILKSKIVLSDHNARFTFEGSWVGYLYSLLQLNKLVCKLQRNQNVYHNHTRALPINLPSMWCMEENRMSVPTCTSTFQIEYVYACHSTIMSLYLCQFMLHISVLSLLVSLCVSDKVRLTLPRFLCIFSF